MYEGRRTPISLLMRKHFSPGRSRQSVGGFAELFARIFREEPGVLRLGPGKIDNQILCSMRIPNNHVAVAVQRQRGAQFRNPDDILCAATLQGAR